MADKQPEKSRADRLKPYRWQKGQSGNPKGRPKAITLSEAYRAAIRELVPRDQRERTFAEQIADAIVARAARGEVRAAQEIADRIEGRPPQALTGAHGTPLIPSDRDSLLEELKHLIEEVRGRTNDTADGNS